MIVTAFTVYDSFRITSISIWGHQLCKLHKQLVKRLSHHAVNFHIIASLKIYASLYRLSDGNSLLGRGQHAILAVSAYHCVFTTSLRPTHSATWQRTNKCGWNVTLPLHQLHCSNSCLPLKNRNTSRSAILFGHHLGLQLRVWHVRRTWPVQTSDAVVVSERWEEFVLIPSRRVARIEENQSHELNTQPCATKACRPVIFFSK